MGSVSQPLSSAIREERVCFKWLSRILDKVDSVRRQSKVFEISATVDGDHSLRFPLLNTATGYKRRSIDLASPTLDVNVIISPKVDPILTERSDTVFALSIPHISCPMDTVVSRPDLMVVFGDAADQLDLRFAEFQNVIVDAEAQCPRRLASFKSFQRLRIAEVKAAQPIGGRECSHCWPRGRCIVAPRRKGLARKSGHMHG